MSLFDMIEIDAAQQSFCIAFAFLSDETETDYIWALKQLKSLYEQCCNNILSAIILTNCCFTLINAVSNLFLSSAIAILICIWHANKTILI